MRFAPIFAVIACFLLVDSGVSAQSDQYPNELEGYKFFGRGKLKDLHLLVSTKDDVKRIFGEKCEKRCDYDLNWSVNFEYFDDIWITERSNAKGDKLTYTLDPKYLGKLRVIELRPKNSIYFKNITFPRSFERIITTSTTDARGGKSRMTVNDAFQDAIGLTYEIFVRTNYGDMKTKDSRSFNEGELVVIHYRIPAGQQRSLFVLKK